MEGQKLGKYLIQEELGKGGFAAVYKAVDIVLQRTVALKILDPQLTREHNFVNRFRVEARLAAGLNHPRIVKIFEFGEEEGRFYIAMELIEGKNLKELAQQQGPLPLSQALDIVGQIGEAVDYLHQQNLIHRDIKASNIVVDTQGQATLLDFSIVRSLDGTRMTTNTSQLGTPEYMAPEVLSGKDATSAADLYALGIVLYELVTGKLPFTGQTPLAVIKGHVYDEPPSPREFVPTLPKLTNKLMLQALEKEPTKRMPTAGAWLEALRNSVIEKPRPRLPSLPALPPLPWKRITTAGVGLGLLSLLLFAGFWFGGEATELFITIQNEASDQNEAVTIWATAAPTRRATMTPVNSTNSSVNPTSTRRPTATATRRPGATATPAATRWPTATPTSGADRDGDGVADAIDKCPDLAGNASDNPGCPFSVEQTEQMNNNNNSGSNNESQSTPIVPTAQPAPTSYPYP